MTEGIPHDQVHPDTLAAVAGVQDFLDEFPADDPDSFMAKHFVIIPVTILKRKAAQ